jgi:thioredoxin-dependent peroxiredoxin
LKTAPTFNLPDQNGVNHSLADYAGRWLVLYLYPKDDTPGCTAEACAFRDAHEDIAALPGVQVVGVSTDSIDSHQRFARKHNLSFSLLSDPDHTLINELGAWTKMKFGDHEYIGTKRSTFIVNPKGQIVKTYVGVQPEGHVQQVLADLAQLTSRQS